MSNINPYEQRLKKVDELIKKNEESYHSDKLSEYKDENKENKINILIRTCLRPNYFKKCIESILSQEYHNYVIHVAYDRNESYDYIAPYTDRPNIFAHYINKDQVSKQKYRFNLYCNDLMDHVEDGFIIFLDDDDMFTHCHVLQMINDRILDEKTIVLWNFSRPDSEICPSTAPRIYLGRIDTSCVCFHSKWKGYSRWPDRQCGDFLFYSTLMKNLGRSVRYVYANAIWTKTIYTDHIANLGKIGE